MAMSKVKELTDMRFGRLLVMAREPNSDGRGARWWCLCDCGKTKLIDSRSLIHNHIKSCGCLNAELSGRRGRARLWRHGFTASGKTHPLYRTWVMMNYRCRNPRASNYGRYGGRGIRVCERWRRSFPSFLADMGERPLGTTLDRINPDGDYEPGNVRWATPKEQQANRRDKGRLRAAARDALEYARHTRWHTNRKTTNRACALCAGNHSKGTRG